MVVVSGVEFTGVLLSVVVIGQGFIVFNGLQWKFSDFQVLMPVIV